MLYSTIQIAVCEMKETRSGVYTRVKAPYVEMEAYRSDSYITFVKRAAHKCHLTEKKNKLLSLFKLNGARVLDEEVTVKGKPKPWTLGNYLLLMKKSPNNIKMGIGYVDCDFNSSSDSTDDKDDKVL